MEQRHCWRYNTGAIEMMKMLFAFVQILISNVINFDKQMFVVVVII